MQTGVLVGSCRRISRKKLMAASIAWVLGAGSGTAPVPFQMPRNASMQASHTAAWSAREDVAIASGFHSSLETESASMVEIVA